MTACLPFLLTGLLAAPDTLPPFPIGVYWPTERLGWTAEQAGKAPDELQTELLHRLREQHHCNTIWLVNAGTKHWQTMLTQAAEAGVTLLPTPEQVIWGRPIRDPGYLEQMAASAVEALAPYPALGGYVLIDEARTQEMAQMEALRAAFARHDPTRPQVMVVMGRDIEGAARRTQVPILCADPYPFFGPSSPNGPNAAGPSRGYYRQVVRHLVELCEETGKTPWVMPQMFGDAWGPWRYDDDGTMLLEAGAHRHWRTPTLAETRWEIWEAVAQGAKGVLFYVLFGPKNERQAGDPPLGPAVQPDWPQVTEPFDSGEYAGLVTPRGESTPQLIEIGESFADLERLGPELIQYRSSPAVLAVTDVPVTLRTLYNPATDETLVAAVNDDFEQPVEAVIRPLVEGVGATELRTGRRFEPGEWRLRLQAGDGALLKLAAPRRWALLWDEGFALPNHGVQLSGLTVTRTPRMWGIGLATQAVGEGDAPGTATVALDSVAGKNERGRLRLYLRCEGTAELAVGSSADGEIFGSIEPSAGVWEIPATAAKLQVTVPAEGRLSRLVLTGIVK